MKALKKLDAHFEEYIMGVLLIGITVIMLFQIVMRMMKLSLSWAEELARYFYIWSVFLSLGYTIKNNSILRVDLLLNALPKMANRIVEVLLQLTSCGFYTVLAYCSVGVLKGVQASGQTTPALEWPMYFIYAIIPVAFLLAALRNLQRAYGTVRGRGPNEIQEETVA